MKTLRITQRDTLKQVRRPMPRPKQVIVDKVTKRRSRKAQPALEELRYDDNCLPSL